MRQVSTIYLKSDCIVNPVSIFSSSITQTVPSRLMLEKKKKIWKLQWSAIFALTALYDPMVHIVVYYRSRLVGLTHHTIDIEYQQEKCD